MTVTALKKYMDAVERMCLDPMTVYVRGVRAYMRRSGGAYIWDAFQPYPGQDFFEPRDGIRVRFQRPGGLSFEIATGYGEDFILLRGPMRTRWYQGYRHARVLLRHYNGGAAESAHE